MNGPLPTFLGIGAPRCATTWLHRALDSHPETRLPTQVKEVHFFDRYYERGLDWYGQFFVGTSGAGAPKAVGEITPHYLYHPDAPQRVKASLGASRLIVVLRDPADRAFSHYLHLRQVAGYSKNFTSFMVDHPEAIEQGRYALHLERWIRAFGRESLLIGVLERDLQDLNTFFDDVCDFIGVGRVNLSQGQKKPVNVSGSARYPRLLAFSTKLARRVRDADNGWLLSLAKATGMVDLVRSAKPEADRLSEQLLPELRAELRELYLQDVEALAAVAHLDVSCWGYGQ